MEQTSRKLARESGNYQPILDAVYSLAEKGIDFDGFNISNSEHAEKYGYNVVERFVGHGVGPVFHSEPLIYHYRK